MLVVDGDTIELAEYKIRFIRMLMESGALKVGDDFVLKSKRESPYFINIGGLNSGSDTSGLASAYADAIAEHLSGKFDMIYGIPEKGVGLAPTVSVELSKTHDIESNWFFTRKFGKTYGESTNLAKNELAKGMIVGKLPSAGSKIILLDDVLTTGDAKYQAIDELNKLLDSPQIVGLVIAVDRQEVGVDGKNAIDEFTKSTGIKVYSIIKATEIYGYLSSRDNNDVDFSKQRVQRMATYLRTYGTEEARKDPLLNSVTRAQIVNASRSIIPACDIAEIQDFERLVGETSKIDGIGGYKIGFELGLKYGLPAIVQSARKYTNKPLIYDHQKAGTDIPDTAKNFMNVVSNAGIDAVILFPHSGPETERAWIYRALDNGLGVIVGGRMSHQTYTVSEGGFISDEGTLEIYRIAARAGVREFVVPGTKPEIIKSIDQVVRSEGIDNPIFYAPGLGAQGGKFDDVKAVLGDNWHPIVGRQIITAKEYGIAAQESVNQFIN